MEAIEFITETNNNSIRIPDKYLNLIPEKSKIRVNILIDNDSNNISKLSEESLSEF